VYKRQAELLSAASRTAGIIAIMSTRFGQTRRQFPHVVQSHRSATANRSVPVWTLRWILRGPYSPTMSTGQTGVHFPQP